MKGLLKDFRFVIGSALLVIILFFALFRPLLPFKNPDNMCIADRLAPPGLEYLLGTDQFGRDLLSRLLVGTRTSLTIALSSVTLAALGGTLIGEIGGYSKGTEMLIMRLVDLLLVFPPLVLAIVVIAFFGRSNLNLVLLIGALYTPIFARLAYGSTKSVKEEAFVEASQAIGSSRFRIARKTILPNILSPLVVQFSLSGAHGILLESGLSFLGLGVKPPTASLGQMIARGRSFMYLDPLYMLWPSFLLAIIVLCMNLMGDALRDYLDPRIQRSVSNK